MPVFEAIMLLCFGFAWPVSIYRSYKSRSTKGKSFLFSVVVIVGYVSGIINKVLNGGGIVLALYILNALMVSTDALLWLRNRRIERAAETGAQAASDTPPAR